MARMTGAAETSATARSRDAELRMSAAIVTAVAVAHLARAAPWGIARRRGLGWWPGLLVAAVVASLFRWLDIAAFTDSDLRFAFAALVYHVVPAVLAGLACWWIDVREAGG
jgi:hypothetical protein